MTSRRDLIVDALAAKLAEISTAGGFNTDPTVQKAKLPRNDFLELPLLVLAVSSESKSASSSIDVEGRLVVNVECFPDQSDGTVIVDAIDDLVEDVERVLLAESELDPPLGVAGVTEVGLQGFDAYAIDLLGLVGATMTLVVRYRHDLDDPATYRGATG